jgi:hypothetical protein
MSGLKSPTRAPPIDAGFWPGLGARGPTVTTGRLSRPIAPPAPAWCDGRCSQSGTPSKSQRAERVEGIKPSGPPGSSFDDRPLVRSGLAPGGTNRCADQTPQRRSSYPGAPDARGGRGPGRGRQANRHGHRDATMILLAFRHGLRAVELCDLRWDPSSKRRCCTYGGSSGTPSTHPLRSARRGPIIRRYGSDDVRSVTAIPSNVPTNMARPRDFETCASRRSAKPRSRPDGSPTVSEIKPEGLQFRCLPLPLRDPQRV